MLSKNLHHIAIIVVVSLMTNLIGVPIAHASGQTSYIRCNRCYHEEEVSFKLFVKILGGAVAGAGFWAWVAYIFAGTGLALPICIAIITGGVGIAAYSNEIAQWMSEKYPCPSCGQKSWRLVVH